MKVKPFKEKRAMSEAQIHANPLLNRVYQNRGITTPDELEYSISKLLPPHLMKGMDEGVDLLITHIMANSKIVVIGDYDCDGATSTSIAVEGLKMMGSKNVEFLVPDRIKHGYGLSPPIVEIAAKREPDLIVTVDNGISAFAGAEAVKRLKKTCQLLITDHHLASPNGVPDADAIINPNQPGCQFPSKNIAGCGVIFYTILALRARMRERNLFDKLGIGEPRVNRLLDLVALGTVADVVRLDLNNRIIVSAGLNWINSGMCRPGLKKMLELKGAQIGQIVASDFGFKAGPCINAAGRLDDMTIGIRCLLEQDETTAEQLAQTLVDLNEARKEIEAEMVEGAMDFIDDLDVDQQGVALYDPTWHEGVVGIVASRVKDKLDKPIICFTDTHELAEAKARVERAKELNIPKSELDTIIDESGEYEIKGSARSIPGIHLKHVLDEISKNRPEILTKFGGHAMAAGLSIKSKHLDEFRVLFNDLVSRDMTEEMKLGLVEVDIDGISADLMTLENAEALENEGIWGQGFEAPMFSQKFEVLTKRVLKDKHLKLRVKISGADEEFDAIAFSCVDRGVEPVRDFMEASFRLSVNEWKGRKSLQLMVDHLQDPELAMDLETAKKEDAPLESDGAAKEQKKKVDIVPIIEGIEMPF